MFIRQAVTKWIGADRAAPTLREPESAAEFVRGLIKDDAKEHFISLLLDSRHGFSGYQIVSVGTLASSLVHPREVFAVAVRECAHAILLAHNHPSGDSMPSYEDRTITKRLLEASRVLGIPIVDHLILGAGQGFTSMARLGLMSGREWRDEE